MGGGGVCQECCDFVTRSAPHPNPSPQVGRAFRARLPLNVHLSLKRKFLNELAAWFDDVAHQAGEHAVGGVGVVDEDA